MNTEAPNLTYSALGLTQQPNSQGITFQSVAKANNLRGGDNNVSSVAQSFIATEQTHTRRSIYPTMERNFDWKSPKFLAFVAIVAVIAAAAITSTVFACQMGDIGFKFGVSWSKPGMLIGLATGLFASLVITSGAFVTGKSETIKDLLATSIVSVILLGGLGAFGGTGMGTAILLSTIVSIVVVILVRAMGECCNSGRHNGSYSGSVGLFIPRVN